MTEIYAYEASKDLVSEKEEIKFNNIITQLYSCLVHLTDYIIKGMDEGQHTGMILIDLQKAFGTLGHNVLLKKNGTCRF